MELLKVVDLIKDFLVPANKLDQNNLSEISLLNIVNNIIDGFASRNGDFYQSLIDIENETDSYWKFALVSIQLLTHLNNAQYEPSKTGCYLSVNQEIQVKTLVQLVISFGIHYNLEDNVGVSIDRLSKYGVNIKLKRIEIEPKTRNNRLSIIINYLNLIRANKREHVDLIDHYFYRKYLHEIVCSLVQLNYSPNSTNQQNDGLKKWLEIDLFEETQGSLLISALLMAQSSASNSWFTLKIGQLLTKCLLRPNSVMNVIKAILTEINAISNVSLESDWKKCDLIAQIVAQCPREMTSEEYVKFIAPQLLDLFFKFDLKYVKHFHRVAGSIYAVFARRWPQLTFEHLTSKLIQPLNSDLTNKHFQQCLNNLNLVFVLSTPPSWPMLTQLPCRSIYLLFDAYTQLGKKKLNSSSKTKSSLEDILKLYIKMMPSERLNPFLTDMLKNGLLLESNEKMIAQFNFDMFDDDLNDETSNINVIKFVNNPQEPIDIETVELKCSTLVRLIKSVQDSQLEVGFLLYLFNELNDLIKKQVDEIEETNNSKNDQTFVRLEKNLNRIGRDINLKIIFFTQISALFESIDIQLILEQNAKIIDFCAFILKNLLILTKSTPDSNGWKENEYELIHLLLSVISVFTNGVIEIDYDIKKKLLILIPLLAELKETYPDTDIESMSDNLFVSIGTLGGVPSEDFRAKKENPSKSLIEEIGDDYERALHDLNDPLLPVKAHGLVTLRKLIESKNPTCLANKTSLIDLFMKYLKNDDSYLYLAAINGIISVVDMEPDRIIGALIEEYLQSRLDVDSRLKIGEVLTKTVRKFNELVPKYGRQLVNAFLFGCKLEDDFLKASSLSNLGETCKLLNYSLGENIYEILNCLSSLIDDSGRSIEVKRSATMVLKMIIEGLKKDTFIDILGSSITSLYKLLIRVKSTSQDDIIRLNCQLTSDYINELMKESMFPKQKLQKEIKILSA